MSNVNLLMSNNWELWMVEIKPFLMHFSTWQFIDGLVEKDILKGDKKKATVQLIWRKQQELNLRRNGSYTVIYQSLSKEFRPLISSTTDGAVAWRIF